MISKQLVFSRTTVPEYLKKVAEEMGVWMAVTKQRKLKLDVYQPKILNWIRQRPNITAAIIYDQLEENYTDFSVAESTIRSCVNDLRETYHLKNSLKHRIFTTLEDCNAQSLTCLERRGNGKIHKIVKKTNRCFPERKTLYGRNYKIFVFVVLSSKQS